MSEETPGSLGYAEVWLWPGLLGDRAGVSWATRGVMSMGWVVVCAGRGLGQPGLRVSERSQVTPVTHQLHVETWGSLGYVEGAAV